MFESFRLPTTPTLTDIAAHIPEIRPRESAADGPFWSVMIPTLNSGPYLERTLLSVLTQDLGPGAMQIEVVDCGSTEDDPESVVRVVGEGRVAFSRIDENKGPSHSFNECIRRSRGQWIHILHGDDMVAGGFYGEYERVIRKHPDAIMVGGQATQIDPLDVPMGVYGPPAPEGGCMTDFIERQAVRQLLLFNAVVVRRSGYEAVGGFSTLLHHVCDWDMWLRLGLQGGVAWVDQPLALYRVHGASDTSVQRASGANTRETYCLVRANIHRLRARGIDMVDKTWRRVLAADADELARRFSATDAKARYNQAKWAWLLAPRRWRFRVMLEAWWQSTRESRQRAGAPS